MSLAGVRTKTAKLRVFQYLVFGTRRSLFSSQTHLDLRENNKKGDQRTSLHGTASLRSSSLGTEHFYTRNATLLTSIKIASYSSGGKVNLRLNSMRTPPGTVDFRLSACGLLQTYSIGSFTATA